MIGDTWNMVLNWNFGLNGISNRGILLQKVKTCVWQSVWKGLYFKFQISNSKNDHHFPSPLSISSIVQLNESNKTIDWFIQALLCLLQRERAKPRLFNNKKTKVQHRRAKSTRTWLLSLLLHPTNSTVIAHPYHHTNNNSIPVPLIEYHSSSHSPSRSTHISPRSHHRLLEVTRENLSQRVVSWARRIRRAIPSTQSLFT